MSDWIFDEEKALASLIDRLAESWSRLSREERLEMLHEALESEGLRVAWRPYA